MSQLATSTWIQGTDGSEAMPRGDTDLVLAVEDRAAAIFVFFLLINHRERCRIESLLDRSACTNADREVACGKSQSTILAGRKTIQEIVGCFAQELSDLFTASITLVTSPSAQNTWVP